MFWRRHAADRLQLHAIHSEALGRETRFGLLPAPAAEGVDAAQLPLFVVLHGMGGDHRTLDQYGLTDGLHEAMLAGRLPRAHVAAPNGERGFYINWHDGSRRYEDLVLQDVLPAAEERLGLRGMTRARRHIAGASMGGIGALQIGLRHPDRFASIACFSGPILDREQSDHFINRSWLRLFAPLKRIFGTMEDRAFFDAHNPYAIVEARGAALDQRLYLAAGTRDRPFVLETARQFHEFLEARGVPHKWEVYDGGHAWTCWEPLLQRAMAHALAD